MKLLEVLSQEDRHEQGSRYFDWIRRRDGEPDMQERSLSRRKEYVSNWKQYMFENRFFLGWNIARDDYVRACHATSQKELRGLSEPVLWAAGMSCANAAESWGIDLAFKNRTWTNRDDVMTWIELEELYHTIFLEESLMAVGISAIRIPPSPLFRSFIYVAAKARKFWGDMAAMMSELVGVVMFLNFRRKGEELFGSRTLVGKPIHSHLGEISIDEVGHVSSLRTRLGPGQMKTVRSLFPMAAVQIIDSHPVYAALFGREQLIQEAHSFSWDMLPEDVRTQSFLA